MSKKVLVVDDEEAIVEVVRSILKKEGYEVHTALGGIPCIECLRDVNPDIILMDVMMPDMDGWEVLRILKGRGVLEHTKVLMLTVVEEPKEEDTDLSPYIIDYITKPFDKGNLIERVNFISANI